MNESFTSHGFGDVGGWKDYQAPRPSSLSTPSWSRSSGPNFGRKWSPSSGSLSVRAYKMKTPAAAPISLGECVQADWLQKFEFRLFFASRALKAWIRLPGRIHLLEISPSSRNRWLMIRWAYPRHRKVGCWSDHVRLGKGAHGARASAANKTTVLASWT